MPNVKLPQLIRTYHTNSQPKAGILVIFVYYLLSPPRTPPPGGPGRDDNYTTLPVNILKLLKLLPRQGVTISRFFLSIFVVEIQRQNAMVGDDDDRPEVSLLFTIAAGTSLA
jgi:hypothetical protein